MQFHRRCIVDVGDKVHTLMLGEGEIKHLDIKNGLAIVKHDIEYSALPYYIDPIKSDRKDLLGYYIKDLKLVEKGLQHWAIIYAS